jgi:hypothetical protein
MSSHYLSFKNKNIESDVVAYVCNPSTLEVEAAELRIGVQAGL